MALRSDTASEATRDARLAACGAVLVTAAGLILVLRSFAALPLEIFTLEIVVLGLAGSVVAGRSLAAWDAPPTTPARGRLRPSRVGAVRPRRGQSQA
jgi:hypothetical protein